MSLVTASVMAQILPVFLIAILIDNAMPADIPGKAGRIVLRSEYYATMAIVIAEVVLITFIMIEKPVPPIATGGIGIVAGASLTLLFIGYAMRFEARAAKQRITSDLSQSQGQ